MNMDDDWGCFHMFRNLHISEYSEYIGIFVGMLNGASWIMYDNMFWDTKHVCIWLCPKIAFILPWLLSKGTYMIQVHTWTLKVPSNSTRVELPNRWEYIHDNYIITCNTN